MLFKSVRVPVMLAAMTFAGAIYAADNHGHDHDHKPLKGGIVAEANDVNFELVAKSDSLTIFVTDHGKPVMTKGAKASATIYSGSEKLAVNLEASGDNQLVATGSFKTGVGVRVAALVTLPSKPEAKLNFRLK